MNYPLSPLDGRYAAKVQNLEHVFSEFGLMRYRTIVEIKWLIFLAEKGLAPAISESVKIGLLAVCDSFGPEEFRAIKKIEATTNHDVKAVEYFLRELTPKELWPWIHFACTSEDINNTAYGLMLQEGRRISLDFLKQEVVALLSAMSLDWKAQPILCRTHGQTATPSTLGKEFGVFVHRLQMITHQCEELALTAKINGATGTFSAHLSAFPDTDWISLSQEFVEQSLGLDWVPLTTQIESHDQAAALLNEIGRLSNVLIDLSRDIWGYISLGYFGQKTIAGEVGSSTMPHKVNPIDFENAEGNLKLARGIARTLSDELPISRWQRDLTDSTLQRNFGLVFGHFLLAMQSLKKGLGKLELRAENINADLESAPEVLTEAVQTVLRAHGHHDAYEQLKKFSRGQALTLPQVQEFIAQTDLPADVKTRLSTLTPATYTGLAEQLVDDFIN